MAMLVKAVLFTMSTSHGERTQTYPHTVKEAALMIPEVLPQRGHEGQSLGIRYAETQCNSTEVNVSKYIRELVCKRCVHQNTQSKEGTTSVAAQAIPGFEKFDLATYRPQMFVQAAKESLVPSSKKQEVGGTRTRKSQEQLAAQIGAGVDFHVKDINEVDDWGVTDGRTPPSPRQLIEWMKEDVCRNIHSDLHRDGSCGTFLLNAKCRSTAPRGNATAGNVPTLHIDFRSNDKPFWKFANDYPETLYGNKYPGPEKRSAEEIQDRAESGEIIVDVINYWAVLSPRSVNNLVFTDALPDHVREPSNFTTQPAAFGYFPWEDMDRNSAGVHFYSKKLMSFGEYFRFSSMTLAGGPPSLYHMGPKADAGFPVRESVEIRIAVYRKQAPHQEL